MLAMALGRKNKQTSQPQPSSPHTGQQGSPWQTYNGSGGYMATEIPYYDKGKRKIMVYTSDSTGKIIKTFKR